VHGSWLVFVSSDLAEFLFSSFQMDSQPRSFRKLKIFLRVNTESQVKRGGRRTGAGRPRTYTVAKIYKLEPETIERIKTIAQTCETVFGSV
jgi:hypothetical protein